jgi:hypothetical protein
MSAMAEGGLMLAGQPAKAVDIEYWQLTRLLSRKLAPEPRRLDRYRAFVPSDLPALKAAARQAGYLRGGRPAPAI